ncbi:MAG: GNAT family N-acetyltransferase [Pseudomonadota bacterium]
MDVSLYHDLDELPDAYRSLFAQAGAINFFHSDAWFRPLIETTRNEGDELRLYGVDGEGPGVPPLLLVARAAPARLGPIRQRVLSSFTNFYTMRGGPIIGAESSDVDRVVGRVVSEICAERPRWDVIVMKALEPDSRVYRAMSDAFRSAGLIVQPFFQHASWFEPLAGRTFKDFMAARGSKIRKTLQWKNRKIEKSGRFRYEMVTDDSNLEAAIGAYERVYERSWKEAESYPEFIPSLIAQCARLGSLRLGIMYLDDEPVATQLSLLSGTTAFQYKMAYDETLATNPAAKNLSVGTVMILRLLEHLIEVDKVAEFDFGVGDEGFKSEWCTQRREIWGLMALNPRSPAGLAGAIRHVGGAQAQSAIKQLLGR